LILDKNLIFSKAQAVTAVGTHNSEKIADIVEPGDAVNELYFEARVKTACSSAGSATVTINLVTDTDPDLGDPTILWSSGAVPVADLTDKYLFGSVRLPKPDKLEKYLGAQIVVGTAALTGGAFDIYLTDTPQTNING
jgi:hypothetical protein